MIGVAWAGTPATYADFISTHGLTFPNIDDSKGDLYLRYGVAYQPAWSFLRNAGHRTVRGTMSDDDIKAIVDELSAG